MSVLLLRLAGPMQSWGTQSRFSNRDTGLEPSKSGVIGLLCAALGFPRDAESVTRGGLAITLPELAKLKMAVRVDREGRMSRDYHTAGGERCIGATLGQDAKGRPRPYGVAKADGSKVGTVVSERFYLADADFLVGLEGDHRMLEQLDAALTAPVWPLYLGRKAFIPAWPVRAGIVDGELLHVLSARPWLRRQPREPIPTRLRTVIETHFGDGPEVRQDVPVGFDADARRHGHCTVRHVKQEYVTIRPELVEDAPWLT